MKCPVCDRIINNDWEECTFCGFDQLHKEFLNESEYNNWLEETVLPCRKVFQKLKSEDINLDGHTFVMPTGGKLTVPKHLIIDDAQKWFTRVFELGKENEQLINRIAELEKELSKKFQNELPF